MKKLAAVLFVLAIGLSAQAREGFGFKKKAVEFDRTIPPATNAGARRVQVRVTSERDADRDDARTLERYITEHILAAAGTVADSRPEVSLEVALDRLESHETWETYTTYESRQTGTKREWNEKKQKYEDKPVYSNVSVQKERKVVDASLTGAFDVVVKNKDVASGSVSETFRNTYGDYDKAPSPTSVEDDLLKRVAKKVAAQIVPTKERVAVLVPRASFEPLIPLAENAQWDRYLSAVEAMPAKKNGNEEAFRQYALAIAKEAVAYQKENRSEALDLLRAAKSHYETAAALNPGEELFRQGYSSLLASSAVGAPGARVGDSVARYESWSGSGSAVHVASTTPVAGPASSSPGMKNQTVIDLAKAGLSDENIILAIDGAASTQFDVSPDALIALAKNGVSKNVIAHMQKKARR
ncbi:MAG TPA: hypothetical protein VND45_02440 [Thermoanaerobaculia bacterium]|jgi:hypothetical protein|nr:hypothetical protein [Thermoanaerobaculia bacterium]